MSSYGAIHFREIDRAALLQAIEKLAAQRQIKFLIGPDLDGWTAVYPEPSGQDCTIGAALAAVLQTSALHLLVHKEAFLALNLYRGAELIYEYNSNPQYFEELSLPTKPRSHGDITSLFRLVGQKVSQTGIRVQIFRLKQIDGARAISAELLTELARALGIQNAATSYARLFAGDWETTMGWKDFDHIPDLSPQHGAASDALRDARDIAIQDGLLLGTFPLPEPRDAGSPRQPPAPWCLDPHEDRLWLLPSTKAPSIDDTVALCSWVPGQSTDPLPSSDLQVPAETTAFAWSPSRRWLAYCNSGGRWRAMLARTENGLSTRFSNITRSTSFAHSFLPTNRPPFTSHSSRHVFLHDESILLQFFDRSQAATYVSHFGRLTFHCMEDLDTGSWPIALHPSGRWVVVEGKSGRLTVMNAENLHQQWDFITNPWTDPNDGARFILDRKASGSSTLEASMELSRLRRKERLAGLVFSPNGEWLCTGSNVGLRIYRVTDLHLPFPTLSYPPVFSIDARPNKSAEYPGTSCNSVIVDGVANCVLFAGCEGIIESLDLETGRVSTLLDPPGRASILHMQLSSTRHLLVVHSDKPTNPEGRKNPFFAKTARPPELTVWSYPRLSG